MSVTRPVSQTIRQFPARRLLAITPFVIIALGAAVIGAKARVPDNQIARGVRVGDLDLSGKTIEEARTALEQWAAQRQSNPVTLHFSPETGIDRQWKPAAEKLGLGINLTATLDAVSKAGRENIVGQVEQMVGGAKPVQIPAPAIVDDAKLRAYLKRQIAGDVNRQPKNARFVLLRGGGFGTRHDEKGRAVDVDASAAAIAHSWRQWNTTYHSTAAPDVAPGENTGESTTRTGNASQSDATPQAQASAGPDIELALKITPARITSEDVAQIDGVLGTKSSFVNGTLSRVNNIRIAASHINGTLLRAGDTFSYNQIVGPRDEDSGYREAPILVKGRHDKGVAGGICQTSGTLFNAVLKSGLKIVERTHHSTPIGYLPIGLDATVSYGSLDFKFQNDTSSPVYIAASMSGRELTFSLFGKQTPGREVQLVQTSLSRQPAGAETERDSSKPVGWKRVVERGSSGCRVSWNRIIRVDGQVVHRDVISSHYAPVPAIIVVGARAPRPTPVRPVPGAVVPTPAAPGAGGPAPASSGGIPR